jgi:hypothetical protein
MSCKKHFLTFQWERHDWRREVTHTAKRSFRENDQWGRKIAAGHVTCHAQYVCRDCGAVRDGEECSCEPARAETCPVRVALLAQEQDQAPGVS